MASSATSIASLKTSQAEFAERRTKLLSALPHPGLIIIDTDAEIDMTPTCPYRYRPGSEFYYYTGFNEPESTMYLFKSPLFGDNPDKHTRFGMIVPPKDSAKEIWTGQRVGVMGATFEYGADESKSNTDQGYQQLRALIVHMINQSKGKENYVVYFHSRNPKSPASRIIQDLTVSSLLKPGQNLQTASFYNLICHLRLAKSQSEIRQIQHVAEISAKAHVEAMKATQPGMNECEIDALVTYHCMRMGCPRQAYPNIVGSGNNATTLHYEANNCRLEEGQLLLVDAGGEYMMQASDITRTWPVNGQFTKAQREIYELVLKAQRAVIDIVQPGVTFSQLQAKAQEVLKKGMGRLGFNPDTCLKYYPHYIGHWMGMDVHDCGGLDKDTRDWLKFRDGYVLTVEPGLYFPADDKMIPEEYRGIGVRIEDDILVTETGHYCLTSNAPTDPDVIESLVGSSVEKYLTLMDDELENTDGRNLKRRKVAFN